MSGSGGLSLVVFSGGFDRVHYALSIAAAAAAVGRPVSLLFAGRAVRALLPGGWPDLDPAEDGTPPATRDAVCAARGVAGFDELLESCAALGVHMVACEMALRLLDPPAAAAPRADLGATVGGIVGFLDRSAGSITFV